MRSSGRAPVARRGHQQRFWSAIAAAAQREGICYCCLTLTTRGIPSLSISLASAAFPDLNLSTKNQQQKSDAEALVLQHG